MSPSPPPEDMTEVDAAVLGSPPLPDVDEDDDKQGRGQVLVVGGSAETPGAVILAGVAALRAGAGKLQLATVKSAAVAVGIAVPEGRSVGLPETSGGAIDPR